MLIEHQAVPPDPAGTDVASSMIVGLLRTARPKQWLKNVLVFAAPAAAGVLDQWPELMRASVAFVAFCIASSATYFWNDILDIDQDRLHARKRLRPIAAGTVPLSVARLVGSVGLIAAPLVALATGRLETMLLIVIYEVLTIGYSMMLKHIAVLDLVVISSGFVLRAAAGAVAVSVPMSSWFLACVSFGAMFVVTGKRYAELKAAGGAHSLTRATLNIYPIEYLRTVLAIACSGAILAYSLWAFESKGARSAELYLYEISVVPVVVALLRYLLVLDRGEGEAPEEVFLSDRVLQIAGLSWIVVYGLAVYTS
jgi:decaprenyl-phosphate phosphoribosyltransferase